MKQILQDLKKGDTQLVDLPCPQCGPGQLLIRSRYSLISAGTERMLLEFGQAGWLGKIRQQPDKVRQVIDKIKTDGLWPTMAAVKDKLDQALPMGYCNMGEVVEVGRGVTDFAVGDRVTSNGPHAEVVAVPVNLCAKVPDNVADTDAVMTVLAAIALQGIRLAHPSMGESFAVIGLGVLGLLAVQLLRAQGCRVLAIDLNGERLALAKAFGAQVVHAGQADVLKAADVFTQGRGIDGVLIAAATESNEPVEQAAKMSRKRGRIVLLGVTGLQLSRADFYEKELSFQVSCSYGPGRYDPEYELKGHDYPLAYVRWTEQRNFEAVLNLLAQEKLTIKPLISHEFEFDRAQEAYQLLNNKAASLGILLKYNQQKNKDDVLDHNLVFSNVVKKIQSPRIAVLGAGNHAVRQIFPALKKAGAHLQTVVSNRGVSGVRAAKKFHAASASTDVEKTITDADVDAVVIATRHDSHADLTVQALNAGKHVFVEKPLAISRDELLRVEQAYQSLQQANQAPLLMVGFNRRFSPHALRIKTLLSQTAGPKSAIVTVNAGQVPASHWVQDLQVGGGRVVGEVCHFVDLLRYLMASEITGVQALGMTADTMNIELQFKDGSIASIHYFANGHASFPKERLEIFSQGAVLQLDNFRKLKGFGWPHFKKMNLSRQDKGHGACLTEFVNAIKSGKSPMPVSEIFEVTRVTFDIMDALTS
ncbi:MAG: dehydrogenase [Legionellaceae bacterium]|nr:dehydrogenase [Legionellaceae bacterium]